MSEINDNCKICGEPVDLEFTHDIDRETGRFMHRECFQWDRKKRLQRESNG